MANNESQELRKRVIDDVARKADRDFADTRYDWLRSQRRRRLLVTLTMVFVAAYGWGNYYDWPVMTLATLILFGVCLWLLRIAVRGITDYPDEIVDERMREVRGLTYRYAFLGVMALLSIYLVGYIVNQLLAKSGLVVPMSADQLHELAFMFFFAGMALPSAIFAWNEPEV